MAEFLDKDKRDGYTYDVIIKQNDTTFWRATSGALTVVSNKLRFNADSAASYLQHMYGDYEFALNVPNTPSGSEARHWGLRLPGTDSIGAIYFEIVGSVFQVVSRDDGGTAETTVVTWSSYEATETLFRIIWEPGLIQFLIDGVIVATHNVRIPSNALPLRIVNIESDNMDLGYVSVRRAASIV